MNFDSDEAIMKAIMGGGGGGGAGDIDAELDALEAEIQGDKKKKGEDDELDDLEKEFRGDSTGNNVKFLHKLKIAQLMIEKIYNHKISESIDCSKINLRINKQSVINNLVKVVNKLTMPIIIIMYIVFVALDIGQEPYYFCNIY